MIRILPAVTPGIGTPNSRTGIVWKVCLLLAASPLGGSAQPQDSPHNQQSQASFEQLQQQEIARLEAGAETQRQVEQLDDQRLALLTQYRATLKQHEDLEKYNNQLSAIIASQQQDMTSLKEQITRVGTLERDIVPLMSDMLDGLENFIALDLPFFIEERQQRITRLRTLLNSADQSNSEKYRRILEAYQIENDYGRSIETMEQTLEQAGNGAARQTVNILKVGRLALFYQTLDGGESYRWVQARKAWQRLDDGYNKAIRDGIKIAKEQITPNLLLLPVDTPVDF